VNRAAFLRLALTYLVTLVGGSVLFVALFHTGLFTDVNVFFYRGILLLLVATLLTTLALVILWRTKLRDVLQIRDVLLLASLLFSANIVFFTHLPVTADRSITVFMLGYLNEHGGEMTKAQIEDLIVRQYIQEDGAVDKRLEEQLVSGDLVQTGDTYRISEQGKRLMGLYKVIADLFGLDRGNVAP
jgi:hypothetical protein